MKNYLALFLLLSSFAAFGQTTCSVINNESFEADSGVWSGGSRDQSNASDGSWSYFAGGNNSITSTFDFSNSIVGIEIDFNAETSGYTGQEGFYVEISTDGGSSWDELVGRTSNHNGAITTITDTRTYTSNTVIRIRSSANKSDEGVYIDELKISTCENTISNSNNCSTLIDSENFNGGSFSGTIWNDGGSETSISPSQNNTPGGNSSSIRIQRTKNSSFTDTDAIDLSLYSSITFQLAFRITASNSNEGLRLLMDVDGNGAYSEEIGSWTRSTYANNTWYEVTVDYTPTGSFSSQSKFKIETINLDNNEEVYIDDIVINGCDDTAPNPPTNLSSSNITDSSFDLSWSASTSSDTAGYNVYIGGTKNNSSLITGTTTYSVTGLSASTTYSVTVTAVDSADTPNESDPSTALSVTTTAPPDTEAPTPPTNLASSNIMDTSFTVSWTASTDTGSGVAGYNVYIGGTKNNSSLIVGTTYSVTGLSASTTYSVTVTAVDSADTPNESDPSSALSVTTIAAFDGLMIASGRTVTIQSGRNLDLGTTDAIINGDLIMNSDASSSATFITSGTVTTGPSGGEMTYNRYIPDTNWHIVSSPVEGQSFSEFAANNSNNSLATNGSLIAIGRYENSNAAGSRWEYYDTDNTGAFDFKFESGKGYIIKRTSEGTITFVGDIAETTSGNAQISLSSSTSNHLWYAVGNPWPAYIPGTAASTENSILKLNQNSLDTNYVAIVVWDGSQWVEKNFNDTLDFIPGQAFMVRLATNSATNFLFPKSYQKKGSGSDTFFKDEERTQINLFISNDQRLASTRLFYNEIGTPAMDPGYDSGTFSIKRLDIKTRLSESTEENANVDLATQTLSNLNFEEQIVPITLHTEEDQIVSISAEHINLPEHLEIYLEDRQEAQFYNLKKSSAKFVFENAQSEPGRFYLHTKQANFWEEEPEEEPVGAVPFDFHKLQGNVLYFEGITSNEQYRISLYNLAGYKVVETAAEINPSNYEVQLPSYLSKGVYVLRIQKPDGKVMTKKIIVD